MSLKAGGGNLGMTFSTLTYSADMIAVVEVKSWGEGYVMVLWWTEAKLKKHLANASSCRSRASGLLRITDHTLQA